MALVCYYYVHQAAYLELIRPDEPTLDEKAFKQRPLDCYYSVQQAVYFKLIRPNEPA